MVRAAAFLLSAILLSIRPAGANLLVETINLPISPGSAQHIALHCVAARTSIHKGVLFIHGSSFPTMLAEGFEFRGGDSWMDFMAKQGFLSCGLDFLGYGASSRPHGMLEPPDGKTPLLRAPEAAREMDVATSYMRRNRGIDEVHVIAHSWGTIPAETFAAHHPGVLTSLTLFGPVVPVPHPDPESEHVAWWSITARERLQGLYFRKILPAGVVLLEPAVTRKWAREFAASAPHVAGDAPGEIRIPDGPNADIEAAEHGNYPYAPSQVVTPLFVVYGSDDVVANRPAANSTAFLDRFRSSPLKWQLCIHDGTHVMHLERNRWSLYESVLGFIRTAEQLKRH